jgi:hypothetical protein
VKMGVAREEIGFRKASSHLTIEIRAPIRAAATASTSKANKA